MLKGANNIFMCLIHCEVLHCIILLLQSCSSQIAQPQLCRNSRGHHVCPGSSKASLVYLSLLTQCPILFNTFGCSKLALFEQVLRKPKDQYWSKSAIRLAQFLLPFTPLCPERTKPKWAQPGYGFQKVGKAKGRIPEKLADFLPLVGMLCVTRLHRLLLCYLCPGHSRMRFMLSTHLIRTTTL